MDFIAFLKRSFGDRPLPDVTIITLVMYSSWFQLYICAVAIYNFLRKLHSSSNRFLSKETFDILLPVIKEVLFFGLVLSNVYWVKEGIFPIFTFISFFRFLIYSSDFIVKDIVPEKIKNLTFFISFFTLVLAFVKLFVNK
ncbi:MAG: hypothetical protein RSA91_01845 [Bacilli bacterium]